MTTYSVSMYIRGPWRLEGSLSDVMPPVFGHSLSRDAVRCFVSDMRFMSSASLYLT